jgi:hypothetical protein
MKRHLSFVAALGMGLAWPSISYAQVFGTRIEATSCASAVGGNITASNVSVVCGIPPEVLDALVKSRTVVLEELVNAHRETILLLKRSLDLNERQIAAALNVIGEANVPPEHLAAKLIEFAERFKNLQTMGYAQPDDNPTIVFLKAEAQKAIDAGELTKADALLADLQVEERSSDDRLASNADTQKTIDDAWRAADAGEWSKALALLEDAELQQRRAYDRLSLKVAETSARRGEIAIARLRYTEAAKHFAKAAALLPPGEHENKRISYLEEEANALYGQGILVVGQDNPVLLSAIERYRAVAALTREHKPFRWASVQNKVGIALVLLAESEKTPCWGAREWESLARRGGRRLSRGAEGMDVGARAAAMGEDPEQFRHSAMATWRTRERDSEA